MAKKSLSYFYRFNCGMTYYTLSWAFADLGGDMFINLIVSLLLEIPGHLFSNILMHRLGNILSNLTNLWVINSNWNSCSWSVKEVKYQQFQKWYLVSNGIKNINSRQPYKMISDTQTILRLLPTSVIDHFVRLPLKGLNQIQETEKNNTPFEKIVSLKSGRRQKWGINSHQNGRFFANFSNICKVNQSIPYYLRKRNVLQSRSPVL